MLEFIETAGRRLMTRPNGKSYWQYMALYRCSFCGEIITRRKPNLNNSCGCQQFNRAIYRKSPGPNSYIKHDRSKAAINCIHYQDCLDKAGREDLKMDCKNCDKFEEIKNCYRSELSRGGCNPDYDRMTEHKMRLPK